MSKKGRIFWSGMLSLTLVVSSLTTVPGDSEAAVKRKLSNKKITIRVGKSKKVSVKGAKGKKVKWRIKKKSIASIKKSGKYAVKVKGKKKGKTALVCKVKVGKKWKSLKCKVTVKGKNNGGNTPTPKGGDSSPSPKPTEHTETGVPTATATATATATSKVTATATPKVTATATATATAGPSGPFEPVELINTGFENGTSGFTSRGSATVSTVSGGRSGKALSITGRGDTWHGAIWDVTNLVARGATYTFSAWVKQSTGSAKNIKISVDLASDTWPEVAQVSCESGVWTHIEGSYTTPTQFSSLSFYFEGPDGNYDFLVDDLVITQVTEGKEPVDPLSFPSLKESYSGIFEHFGNVLSYNTSWNNGYQLQQEDTMKFVQNQFNSFTLENEMKPEQILSNWGGTIDVSTARSRGYVIPDTYTESKVPELNFDSVDIILQKAKQYGIPMRAHVLMWHQQTATRFFKVDYDNSKGNVTTKVMDSRLEFYVKSVMKHVMDKEKELTGSTGTLVYCWDVVNEYIHRDNVPSNPSWMDLYGDMGLTPTYVKKAFEYAYAMLEEYGVQDKVTLFYNDYDEYDCPDDIVALVTYINQGEKAKICGGIGMQSHMTIQNPILELYAQALDKFLATGLQVQVTELDIGIDEGMTEEDQAEQYQAIMSLIREKHENRDKSVNAKGVTGVTIWGLYDSLSWRSGSSPLLFGAGIDDPKPAFYSVLKAAE